MLAVIGKENIVHEYEDGKHINIVADVIISVPEGTNTAVRYCFYEGKFYELEEHFSISDWDSDITYYRTKKIN